jgi:hypothetical protein
LFACFKEKQSKQTFFSKKICFVDRFFLSSPPQVLGFGWFFFPPKALERNFVVFLCFFALLVWGMLTSYKQDMVVRLVLWFSLSSVVRCL